MNVASNLCLAESAFPLIYSDLLPIYISILIFIPTLIELILQTEEILLNEFKSDRLFLYGLEKYKERWTFYIFLLVLECLFGTFVSVLRSLSTFQSELLTITLSLLETIWIFFLMPILAILMYCLLMWTHEIIGLFSYKVDQI
jgi:hypothetical protein